MVTIRIVPAEHRFRAPNPLPFREGVESLQIALGLLPYGKHQFHHGRSPTMNPPDSVKHFIQTVVSSKGHPGIPGCGGKREKPSVKWKRFMSWPEAKANCAQRNH
jgi:hypothetical protein